MLKIVSILGYLTTQKLNNEMDHTRVVLNNLSKLFYYYIFNKAVQTFPKNIQRETSNKIVFKNRIE
jgi:hypothetical protein